MGREVRRVPADWQHPKDDRGRYKPLLPSGFAARLAEWDEGNAKWLAGFERSYGRGPRWVAKSADRPVTYAEWDGSSAVG